MAAFDWQPDFSDSSLAAGSSTCFAILLPVAFLDHDLDLIPYSRVPASWNLLKKRAAIDWSSGFIIHIDTMAVSLIPVVVLYITICENVLADRQTCDDIT